MDPIAAAHPRSIVHLLRERASRTPDLVACRFVDSPDHPATALTYGELDRRARGVAAQLQERWSPGARALLLYPSGLEFVVAYFGCLYAGVIAVPAYPPAPARLQRSMTRLLAIGRDANPAAVLTGSEHASMIRAAFVDHAGLGEIPVVATDVGTTNLEAAWRDPGIDPTALAFLQYTSGSTSTPRGVMISHRNLIENLRLIYLAFDLEGSVHAVSWLPVYHDMGLISCILTPIYAGFPMTLMPSVSFLRDPLSWLRVISDTRTTAAGAPTFAFDLCVRKIPPARRVGLDLSGWRVAFCGAEPLRQDVFERFAEAFAGCGFRPEFFYPCYGLAEATVLVTAGRSQGRYLTRSLDKERLTRDHAHPSDAADAVRLVGSGKVVPEISVEIVDPTSRLAAKEGQIGEIWVGGPCVAEGYWNAPADTESVFGARLADSPDRRLLRTGDLGFVDGGELFVTGRSKDLIIIKGRNHYPHDLERTAEQAHAAVRTGCGAAFSIEHDGEERLVMVHELDLTGLGHVTTPTMAPQAHSDIIRAIASAIAVEHDLQPHRVVLIKRGSMPKTSSGKLQRQACKADFLAGTLVTLASSPDEGSVATAVFPTREELLEASPARRYSLLLDALQTSVARRLRVPPAEVDLDKPLYELGLDSLGAIQFKVDLERLTGSVAPSEYADQSPSLAELAGLILVWLKSPSALMASSRGAPTTDGLPPTLRGDAVLGSLTEFQRDPFGFFLDARSQLGDIFRMRLGSVLVTVIWRPAHLRQVLKDHHQNYRKIEDRGPVGRGGGRGLLTSPGGEHWLKQRRLVQPVFHRTRIAHMIETMAAMTADTLAGWRDPAGWGQPIDVTEQVRLLTSRVTARALMGAAVDDESRMFEALDTMFDYAPDNLGELFARQTGTKDGTHERRWDQAHQAFDQAFFRMLEARRRRDAPGDDLLSTLLAARDAETGDPLSDAELRDNLATIFVAGHHTTAMTLSFLFEALARDPEMQRRVQDEVREVLGDRAPTSDDLARLTYTGAVIAETLRLYPAAWYYMREAVVDDVIGGFRIPKGSMLMLCPYLTHHDGTLYPGPEKFDVGRFFPVSTVGSTGPQNFEYLPFGAGPRYCIGAQFALSEMKVVVAMVAQRYRLELVDQTPVRPISRVVISPAEPVRLRARPAADQPSAREPSNHHGTPAELAPFACVALKSQGGGTPWVFVHPGNFPASCYAELLAHMDRPFFLLSPPELEHARPAGARSLDGLGIPEIAARCARSLRAACPRGPYLLGGWSFGGIVASEMASQLLAEGHRVDHVALVDTYAPMRLLDTQDAAEVQMWFVRYLEARYRIRLARVAADGDSSIERIAQAVAQAGLPGLGEKEMVGVFDAFTRGMQMLLRRCERYSPPRYRGAVTSLRAVASPTHKFDGWSQICPEQRVQVLPGEHFTMLAEPYVRALAEQLEACLEVPGGLDSRLDCRRAELRQ